MRSVVVATLLLTSCVDAATETSEVAAPLVGVDGSRDAADRSCNVVLRSLERAPDPAMTNDGWVWTGVVEISAAAAAEHLVPSVIYTMNTAAAWHTATITPVASGATPGYAKFAIRIDHDVPGPGQSPLPNLTVEPYLALTEGGRLFDHNRNGDDFSNYVMTSPDFAVWAQPATCGAPQTPPAAKLVFGADFLQHREGILAPGGTLSIDYATTRLDGCKQVMGGHPQWSLTAWLKFQPGGELRNVGVLAGPAWVPVPSDARGVEVWFESVSISGCHQYDSNFGANYVFAAATAPQWLGLASTLIVRDSGDPCDGGAGSSSGFTFDTWARQRAVVTNLCFQTYQPGITDTDANPWQALDAELHYRYAGQPTWQTSNVAFDRRANNNSRYKLTLRDVDPFRSYHCPEVASHATADGMYQAIGFEYWIAVNGAELRPAPGAAFGGSFVDYPSDPWRTANCH